MPRVASAALALLLAFAASPLAAVQPAAAAVVPPLPEDAGAVEPSAKADPTNRWIVVYNEDTDLKVANGRARGRGIAMDRKYSKALKGYAAKLNAKQLAQVKADPDVAFVAQDGIIRAQEQTIPRGIRRVDATRNTTAKIDSIDERVNADVAIFDTGIDKSHPDLNVVGGYNCSSSNRSAWGDGNGHGTHVAGTVGALDNGIGVVGVAPGVRLWAVRILGLGRGGPRVVVRLRHGLDRRPARPLQPGQPAHRGRQHVGREAGLGRPQLRLHEQGRDAQGDLPAGRLGRHRDRRRWQQQLQRVASDPRLVQRGDHRVRARGHGRHRGRHRRQLLLLVGLVRLRRHVRQLLELRRGRRPHRARQVHLVDAARATATATPRGPRWRPRTRPAPRHCG